MNMVVFNNNNIELIEHNNQAYMTLSQIASALGFKHSSQVNDVFSRHADEFDEEMSCLIKKGRTRVRIFNREGAWLIGMFARTPVAADFRKWVLKTLGSVADASTDRSRFAGLPFDPVPYTPADFIGDKEFMKALGGMVKKCCAVAIREELKNDNPTSIHAIGALVDYISEKRTEQLFAEWKNKTQKQLTQVLS